MPAPQWPPFARDQGLTLWTLEDRERLDATLAHLQRGVNQPVDLPVTTAVALDAAARLREDDRA
jgi:hypothetical protein